jgi:hypothetical protein
MERLWFGVATILVLDSSYDSRITPDFAGLKTLNNPPFPEIVAMSSSVIINCIPFGSKIIIF